VAGEDVADVGVGAVGRVQSLAAFAELFELRFQTSELAQAASSRRSTTPRICTRVRPAAWAARMKFTRVTAVTS
jgi:hypothetical protein